MTTPFPKVLRTFTSARVPEPEILVTSTSIEADSSPSFSTNHWFFVPLVSETRIPAFLNQALTVP